ASAASAPCDAAISVLRSNSGSIIVGHRRREVIEPTITAFEEMVYGFHHMLDVTEVDAISRQRNDRSVLVLRVSERGTALIDLLEILHHLLDYDDCLVLLRARLPPCREDFLAELPQAT